MSIPTVCVIDDNPANLDLLEQELEDVGYRVITATDGPSGLKQIHEKKPDLVLLDVMMPGMSGYEVCRELRNTEQTATLPVIMVTARKDHQDEIVGLDSGANDYVQKPIVIESLLARVRTQLRIKTLQDEIHRNHENLVRAEQERQELISMLTHDMKTPLMTISASLKLLLDRIKSIEPAEALKISGVALRSTTKLQELIEDFLSLIRWDQAGLEIRRESFDIVQAIHHIHSMFPHLIREKSLTLDLDLPDSAIWVDGDPSLISRVCQNVLSNAIKYNRPGGTLKVTVTRGETTVVEISDTGQGIPEHVLPRVFEPYYRDQQQKMIEGSGLGLSVVKAILEAHNAPYEIHSVEGEGTQFRFHLPNASVPGLEIDPKFAPDLGRSV